MKTTPFDGAPADVMVSDERRMARLETAIKSLSETVCPTDWSGVAIGRNASEGREGQ